ncbi:helix-turn-helix transcriptional regulator [Azorhizobium oxalatiphilum]|nr:LuxR C-terminal-related transcriptional regulator [Azorhizobium oxalatiphilum]
MTAALLPSEWPAVLERIAQASHARGVMIVPVTSRSSGLLATESMGEGLEIYFREGWDKSDYRHRALPQLRRAGVAIEQDYATSDDLNKSGFYQFLNKVGFRHSALVGFRPESDFTCFTFQLDARAEPFSPAEAQVLAGMRERYMLATEIMRSLSNSRADGISHAMELSGTACLFFDRRGAITRVNAAAERFLGTDLRIKGGELASLHATETAMIQKKIRTLLDATPVLQTGLSDPVLVTRLHKRPLALRMQRLGGPLPDIFNLAVGIITVEDLNAVPDPPAAAIQRLLSLSSAEAEVAILLAQGLDTREIAAARQTSDGTTRAQIKSIANKLNLRRQSEISALVARLSKFYP